MILLINSKLAGFRFEKRAKSRSNRCELLDKQSIEELNLCTRFDRSERPEVPAVQFKV